jgi:hypothetical protein
MCCLSSPSFQSVSSQFAMGLFTRMLQARTEVVYKFIHVRHLNERKASVVIGIHIWGRESLNRSKIINKNPQSTWARDLQLYEEVAVIVCSPCLHSRYQITKIDNNYWNWQQIQKLTTLKVQLKLKEWGKAQTTWNINMRNFKPSLGYSRGRWYSITVVEYEWVVMIMRVFRLQICYCWLMPLLNKARTRKSQALTWEIHKIHLQPNALKYLCGFWLIKCR